jgi:hypothetical protein
MPVFTILESEMNVLKCDKSEQVVEEKGRNVFFFLSLKHC